MSERFTREMLLDSDQCKICSMIAEENGTEEPTHTCKEHIHYHAKTLDKSADACYKASLELIFAHVADIHMIILKVLSAKYGHSVEEMLDTVMTSPEWKNIYLHPALKTLIYFDDITEETKAPSVRRKKKMQ